MPKFIETEQCADCFSHCCCHVHVDLRREAHYFPGLALFSRNIGKNQGFSQKFRLKHQKRPICRVLQPLLLEYSYGFDVGPPFMSLGKLYFPWACISDRFRPWPTKLGTSGTLLFPSWTCIVKYNISRSGYLPKCHEVLRLPRKVRLALHQILRLPRKMNVINDLRHIWNVISNAWSK